MLTNTVPYLIDVLQSSWMWPYTRWIDPNRTRMTNPPTCYHISPQFYIMAGTELTEKLHHIDAPLNNGAALISSGDDAKTYVISAGFGGPLKPRMLLSWLRHYRFEISGSKCSWYHRTFVFMSPRVTETRY
ncbi:hypothetical protein CRM22_002030 [Opisthorchis felineus]|uniref:Uncharacterized protein n=1 Tax=Opisthorchis felineus TaxID=147828 RepID=A0A4S2M7X1_OPIFE|nr:hypothetical protein CRM22_002030 [Opisthorchis felineus]